jgi:hypothetical protein
LQVVVSVSECSPLIVYIREVAVFLGSSPRTYDLFKKMLSKLSGRVLLVGSHFLTADEDSGDVDEEVTELFPYILETKPPKEEAHLEKWKTQMENDVAKSLKESFITRTAGVLSAYNLECDDLSSIPQDDCCTIGKYIENIIAPAVSYHLMNNKDPEYKNGRLILSSTRLVNLS